MEEVIKSLQDNIDLISRVRIILGTINIEAKHAAEMVSIDNALNAAIDSIGKDIEILSATNNESE